MPNIEGMNWNPVWLPDGRLVVHEHAERGTSTYSKRLEAPALSRAVLVGLDDTDPSRGHAM